MKQSIIILLAFCSFASELQAQDQHETIPTTHQNSGFRIAGVIGHTLVENEGVDGSIFIPSWGLDLEYWWNHRWGIGLHNDIEIETFIIKDSNNEFIERVNPLVLTVDALYQFAHGFVVTLGPGIELDKEKSYYLFRLGIEYEKDISNSLYLLPTIFIDQRFDGFRTCNFGLGVGIKL